MNRNLVKTPITTISSDECLTSYGDTSVLVDKICTKKINDQECPVSLEKDENEKKKKKNEIQVFVFREINPHYWFVMMFLTLKRNI